MLMDEQFYPATRTNQAIEMAASYKAAVPTAVTDIGY
jgi:hypothetical protein